jgi:hypothetical protein
MSNRTESASERNKKNECILEVLFGFFRFGGDFILENANRFAGFRQSVALLLNKKMKHNKRG